MMSISFQPINAATRMASEPAQLVWARDSLLGLLLPADGGWFLQFGLGPLEHEGVLFDSIPAAEAWMRSTLGSTIWSNDGVHLA